MMAEPGSRRMGVLIGRQYMERGIRRLTQIRPRRLSSDVVAEGCAGLSELCCGSGTTFDDVVGNVLIG